MRKRSLSYIFRIHPDISHDVYSRGLFNEEMVWIRGDESSNIKISRNQVTRAVVTSMMLTVDQLCQHCSRSWPMIGPLELNLAWSSACYFHEHHADKTAGL